MTLNFFKYKHSSNNRGIMTPFGFCSCKRRRHSTSVSCQSQDLQNRMHTPTEWFPRAQMFVFLWVSSLDELTRVRLFRSLLTRFLGTDQTKLDINTWSGEKEHVWCQSSLFTSMFFYLQAHCFKHRGVKQDYDSSKSVFFFSAVCNNMNRLLNFSKLVFMQSDNNIALQTQALCRNNSMGGNNWSQGWKTVLSFV